MKIRGFVIIVAVAFVIAPQLVETSLGGPAATPVATPVHTPVHKPPPAKPNKPS